MRYIEPLIEGEIYHIYNRGINSENIFSTPGNYHYFLGKYKDYCAPVLETYSYALLKNHFHLLVRLKEDVVVNRKDGKGMIKITAVKQISHFLNCYAQAFNKMNGRHGKLFEEPFRRKLVNKDEYLTSLIIYIHSNPQHHKFVKDFKDWEFTSWHSILSDHDSIVCKDKVIDWFGTIANFENAHGCVPENIKPFIIE